MAKQTGMEETVERLKDKIPMAYTLNIEQIDRLCELSREDAFKAALIAFDYGFIKGTRAHNNKSVPALY